MKSYKNMQWQIFDSLDGVFDALVVVTVWSINVLTSPVWLPVWIYRKLTGQYE